MQSAETVLDVLRERDRVNGIVTGEPGDRKRSRRVREGGVGKGLQGTSPTSYLNRLSALGADARYREREREHRAMIEQTVEELTPIIGTRPACRALGASVATIYRRRRPPEPKPPKPRPMPARPG